MSELITVVVDQPRTITNVTTRNVATVVRQGTASTAVVRQNVATTTDGVIAVPVRTNRATAVGLTGLQGPPGPSTGAPTLTLPAGDVVQGHFMVRSAAGNLWAVDTGDAAQAEEVVGIALGSTSAAGQNLTAQLAGPVSDSNWSWAPGAVYCGADGRLTQSPSTTGWLLQVGRVLSPTSVDIAIDTPIYRG